MAGPPSCGSARRSSRGCSGGDRHGGALGEGAKSALTTALGIVTPAIIGLYIFGALHAIVLPMLPFIIWLLACIGVATLAVELMIAAPIAAMLHVSAEGEELIEQKQRTIYIMIFMAMLKPTLLVIALVMATVIFSVSASLLNATLPLAFISSQGGSIGGLVTIAVAIAITLYLHYQLCVRSYRLITGIPDAVGRLLGVDGQTRDENDGDMFVGGVVNNTTKVGRGFGQTGMNLASRGKDAQTKNAGQQARAPRDGTSTAGMSQQPEADGRGG